jgi:hypothetical protein
MGPLQQSESPIRSTKLSAALITNKLLNSSRAASKIGKATTCLTLASYSLTMSSS